MSPARLVVIEGPDLGRVFEIPPVGCGIGRGDGNLVKLGDPRVSRQHGRIEARASGLFWIEEPAERTRTLVNGAPVTAHALVAGDEIVLGATKLAFLAEAPSPADGEPAHVTMEVPADALFALTGKGGDRARRHLIAIALLGERLRAELAAGPDAALAAACDAARAALDADRVFAISRARGTALAASGGPADFRAPHALVEKVAAQRHVVTAERAGRAVIAAPIYGAADEITAILWIERAASEPWPEADVLAAGCIALVAGAAWTGAGARERLARRGDALEAQLGADFVGRSPAALRVQDLVRRVAASDATILVGGESGTGKELVAHAIHRASRRADGPFVATNCAALAASLIESELFGHEKGAFTGATEQKAGRFEAADRGTLFLDEIGELPLALQAKLLRVLEDRRVERVGGTRPLDVDVRVIAATNRDLAEMVRRGAFREDLYYRLAVIQLEVPPLRERLADVPLLAEHFLARFRHHAGRRITGFSADALAALARYRWPGNVRELRNAVERAVVLGERAELHAADLPPAVLAAAPARDATPKLELSRTPLLGSRALADSGAITAEIEHVRPARSLRELEKQGILAALAATRGNKAQAAALLQIDRSTLYKKLKDYEIE